MMRAEIVEELGLVVVASGPSEGALVFGLFGETSAIDEDAAAFLLGYDVLSGEEFGLVSVDDGVAGATEHHEVGYCSEVEGVAVDEVMGVYGVDYAAAFAVRIVEGIEFALEGGPVRGTEIGEVAFLVIAHAGGKLAEGSSPNNMRIASCLAAAESP